MTPGNAPTLGAWFRSSATTKLSMDLHAAPPFVLIWQFTHGHGLML